MTTVTDDPLVRFGRWAIAKVWFGVVLSGCYALGRHFDWPQALLTMAAVLGAVALALASSFLPIWTRQRPSGIPVADVGLRVMVWGGLTVSVIALLVGTPAVGMVAAALLLNVAARTFGDPFAPFLRRLRITPAVRYAENAVRSAPRATRPGPTRPGPAHPDLTRPDLTRPGPTRAGANIAGASPAGARPAGGDRAGSSRARAPGRAGGAEAVRGGRPGRARQVQTFSG